VVLLLLGRKACLVCVLWIGAVVAFRYFKFDGPHDPDTLGMIATGDELMAGSLAAIMCSLYCPESIERALRPALLVAIPALMMVTLSPTIIFVEPRAFYAFSTPAACLLFVWLTVLAVRDGPYGNSWGGRVLPALGRMSYGVYVWHFILIWPIRVLENGSPLWSIRISGVILTIVIAWGSWAFFETPLRQFGRGLARRVVQDSEARAEPQNMIGGLVTDRLNTK